jgi:hypothetical protein
MRRFQIGLAVSGMAVAFSAQAVPVTYTQSAGAGMGVWTDSHLTNRYGDFTDSLNESVGVVIPGFDTSLGTLQSVQISMIGAVSHSPVSVYLPEVSGLPIELPFGALAQDTERSLQGFGGLWAYYDAQVSYRADYLFAVDPQISGLFTPIAAEAAFGSCASTADLFLDIGDRNPHCIAGNQGLPLASYNYDWGTVSGAALDAFLNPAGVRFNMNLTGDVYGHCDNDDVGDYCRLNLATNWEAMFNLTYLYDDGTDPGGGGGGGNGDPDPVSVPEPGPLGLLAAGILGAFALRRRREGSLLAC